MSITDDKTMTEIWKERALLQEEDIPATQKVKRFFKHIKKAIRKGIYKTINRLFYIFFKVDENKVLFLAESRAVLEGNLKYVYNEITNPNFKKVLELKAARQEHRSFKHKISAAYNVATSKYIFLEDSSSLITLAKMHKNQEVIQLGHGTGALKKIGYVRNDMADALDKKKMGSMNYTMTIVGTESERWVYAQSYNLPMDKVIAGGFARTDQFFDEAALSQTRKELLDEYPWMKDKKVILFAPTFRGRTSGMAYYDFDQLDLERIYQQFKDEYVFVFKWHPSVYNRAKRMELPMYDLSKYDGFYRDLSEYKNINDLLSVTDVLVTDYSSVMFEYVFFNKPIVHFIYDVDEYNEQRGLIYDYDEYVFGAVAKNCDELIAGIKESPLCIDKRTKFKGKFVSACDGHSTEKTCKIVFGDIAYK